MKKWRDLNTEIDQMKNRALLIRRKKVIQKRINVYSEGIKVKFRQAEYALSMINELATIIPDFSTSTKPDTFQTQERIYFYVDSFFAFLFSTFDVISQSINQILSLNLQENKVSFNKVKNELGRTVPRPSMYSVYKKISGKISFKNLENYRHCSTHRRQIYIESESKIRSGPSGYKIPGTSSASPYIDRIWLLCDNPLSLNPSILQKRELVFYCQKMLKNCKQYIIEIAKEVR